MYNKCIQTSSLVAVDTRYVQFLTHIHVYLFRRWDRTVRILIYIRVLLDPKGSFYDLVRRVCLVARERCNDSSAGCNLQPPQRVRSENGAPGVWSEPPTPRARRQRPPVA